MAGLIFLLPEILVHTVCGIIVVIITEFKSMVLPCYCHRSTSLDNVLNKHCYWVVHLVIMFC